MSASEDRLRDVLVKWYAAVESGEVPDLGALCGGDEELMTRARAVLEIDPLGASVAALPSAPPDRPDEDGVAPPVERLGAYRLRTRIGEGGMGQVYLAEQVDLDRLVAVKILRIDGRADPKARLRLEREAKLASSLDHPNIVPVYAVDEQDGLLYVVMKWLSGPGLEHLVGRVTPKEAAEITAKVARALDEAHASGVLHRDVKPANIILDRGTPYLVDFGLARDLASPLSKSQEFVGTLAYMAPEQLGGDPDAVDARCDVYALGATLFELVTGQRLCAGERPDELLHAALHREALPARFDRRDRDLEAIVQRAVSKAPGDRFRTAGELAEDLDRYLAGEPVRSRPLGPATLTWRKIKRRPRTSAAIAAVLLVATTASVWAAVEGAKSRERIAGHRSEVRSALDVGDLVVAERSLERLRQETAPTERDRALRGEYDARLALEKLLDQLMSTWETQPLTLLERLISEVERTGARRFDSWRTDVGLALASLHLNPATTVTHLDHLEATHGESRASTALRALAERRDEIPRERPADDPLDHVVTFLALRMANAPLDVRREEIDLAADRWNDDYRVSLGLVMHLVDAGEFEVANWLLRSRAELDRPSTAHIGKRAHLLLLCGKLDDAERELARIPDEERTGWDITNRLMILWKRESYESLERELADARAARPDDTFLKLFELQYALSLGDEPSARVLVEDVSATAGVVTHRERARGYELLMRLNDVRDLPVNEQEAAIRALRADSESFIAESPRDRPARANARFALGVTLDALRDKAGALASYRMAVRDDPVNPNPRLQFAVLAREVREEEIGEGATPNQSMSLLHEARLIVEGIFDDDLRREEALVVEVEMEAWLQRIFLASQLGDQAVAGELLRDLDRRADLPWKDDRRVRLDGLRTKVNRDD